MLEAELASLFSEVIARCRDLQKASPTGQGGSLFQYAPFRVGVTIVPETRLSRALPRLANSAGEATRPSNKGMKQTKPSILELRSLSPVFGDYLRWRDDMADLALSDIGISQWRG